MYNQNDLEYLKDMMEQKKLTADEANVELVRMQRVRVVDNIPASVRKALNSAVKSGLLGHMKKDGLRPEVYYHPNFEHQAIDERNRIATASVSALEKVYIK